MAGTAGGTLCHELGVGKERVGLEECDPGEVPGRLGAAAKAV